MAQFMTVITHHKSIDAKEVSLTFEREILASDSQKHHSILRGVGHASDTNVVDIPAITEAFSRALRSKNGTGFTAEEEEGWSESLAHHGRKTISLAEFTAATNSAEKKAAH